MKTAVKIIAAIIGLVYGYQLGEFLIESLLLQNLLGLESIVPPYNYIVCYVSGAVLGTIFLLLAPYVYDYFGNAAKKAEKMLRGYSTIDLLLGVVGLIIGLIIAMLISIPINLLSIPVIAKNIIIVVEYATFIWASDSLRQNAANCRELLNFCP